MATTNSAGENMTNESRILIPFEILQVENGSNNQQRPDFADTFLASIRPILRGLFPAMETRMRMAQEAFTSPSGDYKDVLISLKVYLQEEVRELFRVCEEQGAVMRDHQSMTIAFDEVLRCKFLQKTFSGVFFLAAAAICAATGAVAATKAQNNPAWTAGAGVAAAATIVLAAMGSGVHWVLDKREIPAKQGKEAIAAMIAAEQLAIGYLRSVSESVSDLYSQTVSVIGRVVGDDDGGDGDDVSLGMDLAALNRSFQELRVKANQYGLDVNSVTETALQTIIRNYG